MNKEDIETYLELLSKSDEAEDFAIYLETMDEDGERMFYNVEWADGTGVQLLSDSLLYISKTKPDDKEYQWRTLIPYRNIAWLDQEV